MPLSGGSWKSSLRLIMSPCSDEAMRHCPTLVEHPLPLQGKTCDEQGLSANWPWGEESRQLPETLSGGSSLPLISIVTPSFNQGQFIEETIRSVLLQGYPYIEYLIIDGGSTDGSLDIIKKYEPWLAYWVSEPDRGQAHAINKGIKLAKGEILLWLNADDICLQGSFETVVNAFQSNPNCSLVIGQAQIIDSQSNVIGELQSHFTTWEDLITNPRNSVRQVATFFSHNIFEELGMIDESLQVAMDTELLIRFTQYHKPFILNEYLTAYRTHSEAKSYGQLVKGFEEADQVREKYFPNKNIEALHHKQSAVSWLSLSTETRLSIKDRLKCVEHAFYNNPYVFLSRRFWSSLKRITFSKINK